MILSLHKAPIIYVNHWHSWIVTDPTIPKKSLPMTKPTLAFEVEPQTIFDKKNNDLDR